MKAKLLQCWSELEVEGGTDREDRNLQIRSHLTRFGLFDDGVIRAYEYSNEAAKWLWEDTAIPTVVEIEDKE